MQDKPDNLELSKAMALDHGHSHTWAQVCQKCSTIRFPASNLNFMYTYADEKLAESPLYVSCRSELHNKSMTKQHKNMSVSCQEQHFIKAREPANNDDIKFEYTNHQSDRCLPHR